MRDLMRNIVKRMFWSLIQDGIYSTYLKINALLTDPLFDVKYGVDTRSVIELDQLTINSRNIKYGTHYQPTKVIFLRKLFQQISYLIPYPGVLLDLGCGKGRVLLLAAECGIGRVRGVEFAHELCETAKYNIEIYKAKSRTEAIFSIIESDVANYPIQRDENVFFMFNPFDDYIMEKVIHNISLSLNVWPRKILIIYLNPRYDKIINSLDGIKKIREYNYGYKFAIYSNMGNDNLVSI